MNESEIRHRFDELVEASRATDLDCVMSIYGADIVSFDVEPPLQHVGAAAKRKNWARVFSMYQRPLDYEIRDLAVVAFYHRLGFVETFRTPAPLGLDRRS